MDQLHHPRAHGSPYRPKTFLIFYFDFRNTKWVYLLLKLLFRRFSEPMILAFRALMSCRKVLAVLSNCLRRVRCDRELARVVAAAIFVRAS